jgi:DNA-binding transcriptional LysR family regulator
MRFSLRQLRVFVEVARHESVSRAATTLALSQSATSTALAELERQYDTQLFDRFGKTLRLNELGQALLPQAVEWIERAAAIENVLEGRAGYGLLRIGATLTIGNYLATLIVADFLKRHPESTLQLRVHNTAAIIDQLVRHELDLGLIEGSCRHPDLHVEPWVADELVVFCAPAHPLASRGSATLAELAGEAWIVREPGSGTRETLDQALRHHHSALNIRLELEHTEAIKRAVEFGLGIGCISRLALREAFRRGSLVAIETPELDLRRDFQFLWQRRKFQTAGMREFIGLCRAMTAGCERSDQIEWSLIP